MNEQQLAQLKQLLLQEKDDIQRQINSNENFGMERAMTDSVGELSGYDNHPADLGTELFERSKDLALNETHERRLQEVEAALNRMEKGEYGLCRACGKEISFDRLKAVPAAEFCVEHHPNSHSSMRRPVEEEDRRPEVYMFDPSEVNFYDGEDAWQEVEQYGTSNPPDFFADGRNYNELTIEHDEQRGYVDLTEGFSIVDLDGNSSGITEITHNQAYRQKDWEETNRDQDQDFIG